MAADRRLAVRQERVKPQVCELKSWMETERGRLSRHSATAKAIDYMLKRWPAFTRFLDDGRICLSNNAAERRLRGIAIGRKAWLFCRLRSRRRARGVRLYTHRNREAEQRRPASLACGRIAQHQRSPGLAPR